jgi:hypothetical protein
MFVTGLCQAAFPTHSNICTVDVAKVTGNYDSFTWSWVSGNSQTATIYVVNSGQPVDFTGMGLSFKLATETVTGRVNYIVSTNIAVVTNRLTFGVGYANIPAPANYQSELFGWQGSTNFTRSLFQGMVNVVKSLF